MRINASAQAGERGADHEDHQLVAPGRDADGFGQRFVLADCYHVATGRRTHDQIGSERGERGDDEHQIVEAGRSRDRERCRPKREIGLRNARKSHVTAGEADPVLGDGLPDNDEAERTHHEGRGTQPERRNAKG